MAKIMNMIRLALSAKSGDVLAQSELGIRLYTGEGIKPDYREAVKWLTLASDAGDADATCVLGSCLLYGHGIEKNPRRALLMFEKAAEKGCVEAHFQLGDLLSEPPDGWTPDYDSAIQHYLKAGELGDPDGYAYAGMEYEHIVPSNDDEAFKCYCKAYELGSQRAFSLLGACYEYGTGCEPDIGKAMELFRKGAEMGDGLSQISLAEIYDEGRGGVEVDQKEALRWYREASKNGIDEADEMVEALEEYFRSQEQ